MHNAIYFKTVIINGLQPFMNMLDKAKKLKSSHFTQTQSQTLKKDTQSSLQTSYNYANNLHIHVDQAKPKKAAEVNIRSSQTSSKGREKPPAQFTYKWDEVKQTAIFQQSKQNRADESFFNSIIDLSLVESQRVQGVREQKESKVPAAVGKILEKFQRTTHMGSRSQMASKSNSKLKLRDYIYMVESSSKRSPNKSLNKSQSTFTMQQGSKFESPSKRQNGFKYHISDGEMIEIVKKDMKEDIKNTCMSLQKLECALCELKGEEGSYDQEDKATLLTLYHIRRVIKDEINQRIQTCIAQIQKHQNPHLQQSAKKTS